MILPDKFKIRISHFAYLTIIHDCKIFKCVKKDGSPNISSFINHLLPTLLKKREALHKKIKHKLINSKVLKPIASKDSNYLLGELETILDIPISTDYLLDELSEEIWIRPDKNTNLMYEKIWNIELAKYGLDFSQYMRFLLNDYCSLQQFKREELFFYKTLEYVRKITQKKNAIDVKIEDRYLTILPIEFYSDYLNTDMTYLIYAIEWDSSHIYITNLVDIDVVQLNDTLYNLNQKQIDVAYDFIYLKKDVANTSVLNID